MQSSETITVVLDRAEEASGLATMVQQFLEQTLAESPRKASRARRLSGAAVLRSAEDKDVAVRIQFAGDRIELSDGAAPGFGDATITADFLTIAHLTSGQESPFKLFLDRRLKARFALVDVPFLLGVLSLMRSRPAAHAKQRKNLYRLLWVAVTVSAVVGVSAIYWWWFAGPR